MSAVQEEALDIEVVGLIERWAEADEHGRHQAWMMRVLLGVEQPQPELLGCRRKAGTQGGSRVDLWCPRIEQGLPGGAIGMYLLRPVWTRPGWRLNDSGYFVDCGGTQELLYRMAAKAAGLVGLDWLGRPDSELPAWRIQDHLPRYRETIQ